MCSGCVRSLVLDWAAAALINSWFTRTGSSVHKLCCTATQMCAFCRHPLQCLSSAIVAFAATFSASAGGNLKHAFVTVCPKALTYFDTPFPFSLAPSCLVVVVYLRTDILKQTLNLSMCVNHWLIAFFCIYFLVVSQQAVLFQRSWLDFWKSQLILTTISWQFWN